MSKIFSITIVILLFSLACCEKSRIIKKYFANGSLYYKIELNSIGQKHGISELYYPNSKLCNRINYKNGQKHGVCELFCENGGVDAKLNYMNGIQFGNQYYYYCSNSKLKRYVAIDAMGEVFYSERFESTSGKCIFKRGLIMSRNVFCDSCEKGIVNTDSITLNLMVSNPPLTVTKIYWGILVSPRNVNTKEMELNTNQNFNLKWVMETIDKGYYEIYLRGERYEFGKIIEKDTIYRTFKRI